MPTWDFLCDHCGRRVELTMSNWRDAANLEHRCDCGGILKKQPPAPNFRIHGYSAKNGYSK